MYPILFRIGSLEIGSYGVMMALAFIVCAVLLRKQLKDAGYNPEWANNFALAAAIGGIVGARLYFVIEHWGQFLNNPLDMILSRGGLTWYGGFIGGFIAVIWVLSRIDAPKLKVADMVAPLVLLGYAIGRIGCLLSGDGDYGPPSDVPWAIAFPNGVVPTNVPVHPTPIYDTLLAGIFFLILWKYRKKVPIPGLMVSGMLIFYGIERFITEFYRTTPKILFGWMSMAQIISVIAILAGIIWAAYLKSKRAEIKA